MPLEEQQDLLKELYENLQASQAAYQDYLGGGKTFYFAQQLKKYNSRITSLLTSQLQLLAPPLQPDAAALLRHYNAWTAKWEQLAAANNPQPNDVFAFENDITFPRQAARNLEAAHLTYAGK